MWLELIFHIGGVEENKSKVYKFKEARQKLGVPAALMLDTQGPEIRTAEMTDSMPNGVEIFKDAHYILSNKGEKTDEYRTSVSYYNLYQDVEPGNRILIDDGSIELVVEYIDNEEIHCKVLDGGILKSRKSVNIPGVKLNNPALKEKDVQDLTFAAQEQFEFVAASFIRGKDDILAIRKILDDNRWSEY